MTGVLDGLVKGVACAVGAGLLAYRAGGQLSLAYFVHIAVTTLSSLGGFLFYARVWIQGYYLDKAGGDHNGAPVASL